MRTQHVVIRDPEGNYSKPLSLREYRDMRKKYVDYHLEDAGGGNGLFRFAAKDDHDAIECVKTLNWNGIHKLKRIDPNLEKGYDLVGIFLDHVWIGEKDK